MLAHLQLKEAITQHELFEDKTWRLSPAPWPLDEKQLKEIENIGQACLQFYQALELLYTRSWQGKNLLRNRSLKAPWVAEYLDRGKPQNLIELARSKRNRGLVPAVLRPDLLITDNGFALTEMDSVPGGIGLTAFLNRLYGQDVSVVGGERMLDGFYEAVAAFAPEKNLPFIAILVSDEAGTYRPEMEWLAAQLREKGYNIHAYHPSEIMPLGDSLCADVDGNPQRIDIIYRFWELFDLENISTLGYILDAWQQDQVALTPPMRHFQEEKLNLALFHHHLLDDFWRENLSKTSFKILKRCIPRSWIMDPVDLPPNAVLDAPFVGGKPIVKWEQLAEASQKERNLIMKISGFHETAWGARSVLLGSDASREEWASGIQEALAGARNNLHLLQEYRKPKRLQHPVFDSEGTLQDMQGRVRLCPYYYSHSDKAELGGILATFVPADKKIVHGMRDGAMLPCALKPFE